MFLFDDESRGIIYDIFQTLDDPLQGTVQEVDLSPMSEPLLYSFLGLLSLLPLSRRDRVRRTESRTQYLYTLYFLTYFYILLFDVHSHLPIITRFDTVQFDSLIRSMDIYWSDIGSPWYSKIKHYLNTKRTGT